METIKCLSVTIQGDPAQLEQDLKRIEDIIKDGLCPQVKGRLCRLPNSDQRKSNNGYRNKYYPYARP